ncbi:MAG: hypothetical protein IKE29_02250 [Paenibacillus sp.]|nr:hypothetical protein [Paenibacillus sp.]MBR2563423.1 hypothetical protein [Paenibacillus sp.]
MMNTITKKRILQKRSLNAIFKPASSDPDSIITALFSGFCLARVILEA